MRRRPTPLDHITREGRPKNWGTVIVLARTESNDIILPDGLVFPACRPKESTCPAATSTCRPVFMTRPPETSGNMSSCMHGPHRRPSAPLPTSAVFSSPAGCTSPFCARPPFQMTHAGFHRKTPARSTQNRRRQSSAARNGACSPLRRVFRLGLSDESRVHPSPFPPLHGNACAATLPPRRPSPHSFLERPPKIMLVSAAQGFQYVYFFTNKEQNAPSQQKKQCE